MAEPAMVPQIVLSEPEDELLHLLEAAQLWFLTDPVAVRALVGWLVAEGRAFAETSPGRRWKARLVESELMRRARILWDSSLLSSLDVAEDGAVPSAAIDAIVGMLMSSDLRNVVSRLSEWGMADA